MIKKFIDFLRNQISFKENEKNIIKDEDFENLREKKEEIVFASWVGLLLHHIVILNMADDLDNEGRYEDRLDNQLELELDKYFNQNIPQSSPILPGIVIKNLHILNCDTKHIENFKLFLSPEYEPPEEIEDHISHLGTLYLYYTFLTPYKIIPLKVALQIDYVMTLLLKSAQAQILILRRAGREVARISKGKKGQKKKMADRRQYVLEEYYKVDRREKLSDHGLADKIQKKLEQIKSEGKIKGVPHKDTIKSYLKEAGKIK